MYKIPQNDYDNFIDHNMEETLRESNNFLHQIEFVAIEKIDYRIPYIASEYTSSTNIYIENAIEMLGILEIETGVDAVNIHLDDKEVIELFQNPCGENEKCTLRGVMSLGNNDVMEMLQKFKPKTICEVERIYALATNERLWKYVKPFWEKKIIKGIEEVIVYREEIYEYLLGKGYRSQEAYRLMQDIRRGIRLSQERKVEFRLNGVSDWHIECWDSTRYFTKKEWIKDVIKVAFCLAYYKLNYPREFYLAYWKVMVPEDAKRKYKR